MIDQLKEIYIDGQLDPIETVGGFQGDPQGLCRRLYGHETALDVPTRCITKLRVRRRAKLPGIVTRNSTMVDRQSIEADTASVVTRLADQTNAGR
jgi:hypothetical protein